MLNNPTIMFMDDDLIAEGIALRHDLHQHPELSAFEAKTAQRIHQAMSLHGQFEWHTGLGGAGLVALLDTGNPGPTMMFRSELDALPIPDRSKKKYASTVKDVAHVCGHDGHMAMLVTAARQLLRRPPQQGKLMFLFQPAEETGQGARSMLEDTNWIFHPDFSFAIHNLPGYDLGQVVIREGAMAAGSVGMKVTYTGQESHAAWPEHGLSPVPAIMQLTASLTQLTDITSEVLSLVTIVGMDIGKEAYGTAAGTGALMATIRGGTDQAFTSLKARAQHIAHETADHFGLQCKVEWKEHFEATTNHPDAVKQVHAAASALGLATDKPTAPFRWSEDFGLFAQRYPGALIGLGAGKVQPELHNPEFDFPDELLPLGAGLFCQLAYNACGAYAG